MSAAPNSPASSPVSPPSDTPLDEKMLDVWLDAIEARCDELIKAEDAEAAANALDPIVRQLVARLRLTAPRHEGTPDEGREAIRTVASIAAMLGWMNVPPRHVLEGELRAIKSRLQSLTSPRGAPALTTDAHRANWCSGFASGFANAEKGVQWTARLPHDCYDTMHPDRASTGPDTHE